MLVLEAAQYDPLRAQEIEAGLTQTWWERWTAYHEAAARVAEQQAREAKMRAKRR